MERDVFYRKAKEVGYRARSAFKLLQVAEEYPLWSSSRPVTRAVDLCAAPGSWSQVLSSRLYTNETEANALLAQGQPRIISIDIQEISPIPGVSSFVGDITSESTIEEVLTRLNGARADLVVCDGAPDVTGLRDIDLHVHRQLVLAALATARRVLAEGDDRFFVAKVFQTDDWNFSLLLAQTRLFFQHVEVHKPRSSRPTSSEAFIVCRGLVPGPGPDPAVLVGDLTNKEK